MKREIIELIKENYKALTESEVSTLANQMYELLPRRTRRLCDIKAGSKFKYAGYEFTKLADEEKSCYCFLNEEVFKSAFGDTNDWTKSPIREKLNEFDSKGNSKAIKCINKQDLVAVSLNYTAYKIPNGRTTDRVTLLSYEEMHAYGLWGETGETWLRSGLTGDASRAYCVSSSGNLSFCGVSDVRAVRPALHFKKDLEIEV